MDSPAHTLRLRNTSHTAKHIPCLTTYSQATHHTQPRNTLHTAKHKPYIVTYSQAHQYQHTRVVPWMVYADSGGLRCTRPHICLDTAWQIMYIINSIYISTLTWNPMMGVREGIIKSEMYKFLYTFPRAFPLFFESDTHTHTCTRKYTLKARTSVYFSTSSMVSCSNCVFALFSSTTNLHGCVRLCVGAQLLDKMIFEWTR